MTRSHTLAITTLLALAACGGEDKLEAYRPPIVDPSRLGVACPAPDVGITTDEIGGRTPAGVLQLGDTVYARSDGGSWGTFPIVEATVLPNQQRVRLVLEDGRELVFTPDHALFVTPMCSTVTLPDNIPAGGWVEVRNLLPGWCLDGQVWGVVVRVENAPDGDVVRLSVGQQANSTTWGRAYIAAGLYSLAHNSEVVPH